MIAMIKLPNKYASAQAKMKYKTLACDILPCLIKRLKSRAFKPNKLNMKLMK